MGTIGARQLRRSSLSRERSRRSIEAIETYFGRTIGGNTSNNQTSQETPTRQRVANDNERSVDKTNKRQ